MRAREKYVDPPEVPKANAYVRFAYAWDCPHCGESCFDEFKESVPFRSDGTHLPGEGFWLPEFHECPNCAMWSKLCFHDHMPDVEDEE